MSNYIGSKILLKPLSPFLNDDQVSEILINQPQEVWVEKNGEMRCYPVDKLTKQHLKDLFQLIANENAQVLDACHPLLSGSLYDGSRVQLVLPPVAQAMTLSIRRQVVRRLSLANYAKTNFYNEVAQASLEDETLGDLSEADRELVSLYHQGDVNAFMVAAIKARKTIVISGGTSSGKTTYLNACLNEIDHSDRLCILEDTREIETPHTNKVSLLSSKGEQAMAKVSMQQLVQCCLRLRPDRIIMGEIRGAEILDFISASSTGHEGSVTTIHANSPKLAFMRMTQLYKQNNVPSMTEADIFNELHAVIDVVIQLDKLRGQRQAKSLYYKYQHLRPEGQ